MIELLTQTIDHAAEHSPERDAFRCLGQGTSYGELAERANALAHLLIDQGVKPGDRVGIYMPRCLESAVAVYGIMKAGAAYVPIDPNMPITRVRQLIENCKIRHLTTHKSKAKALPEILSVNTCLESVIGAADELSAETRTLPWQTIDDFLGGRAPNVPISRDALAYIMYTSGSTGRPKGIMHTHASGLSYAEMSVDTYDVTAKDRIGNHSPLYFDMSTFGYFSGPCAGATTILIPEAYTKMPASLSQLMQDERISIWYSVPFALIQLLLRGVIEHRDLNRLRWVLFGGEPFPPKYLRLLMPEWPQARFSNVYGPAEVNQCTYYHIPPVADDSFVNDEQLIPIGKVWDNTEALVLNNRDESIAPGEAGELLIRSTTMMQGYWDSPDLNHAAFYHQPTESGVDQTFYRTGDLVRIDDNGDYVFLGRKDRQIKTRGHRVELDEVEATIASHAEVEEAGVFPVADAEGSNEIRAVVTIRPQSSVTAANLTSYVKERLPWYAVPSQISIEQTLPRTATGKIHRRQLQEEACSI